MSRRRGGARDGGERGARGGSALWPLVLVLALAMVATDFVRHPFAGTAPGDAATGTRDVTLWLAGTDAGSAPARLARAAAAQLSTPASAAGTELVRGGSSAAVLAVLDDDRGERAGLLVVHAGTLADLARERRDAELPGVPQQARRATALLRASAPLALLADDTLLVASVRGRGPRSAGALLASLRARPERLVFGIGRDAWSKAALATFVGAAGAPGHVPYRVLPAAAAAAGAAGGRDVDVVLAPASELRTRAARASLRPLAQSDRGPRLRAGGASAAAGPLPTLGELLAAPGPLAHSHRWVALVAPAALPAHERHALTLRLRALARSCRWRRTLRRAGLGAPAAVAPAGVLARAFGAAATLAATAARVDRLAVSP